MIHELKTLPKYFEAVVKGEKTFEVRKNDRFFHVGDLLALNEFNDKTKCYTGASCIVYIDYMSNDPEYVKSGYVILGIKPCVVCKITSPRHKIDMSADYSVPLATRCDEERR